MHKISFQSLVLMIFINLFFASLVNAENHLTSAGCMSCHQMQSQNTMSSSLAKEKNKKLAQVRKNTQQDKLNNMSRE
jgi:hypothetical protein